MRNLHISDYDTAVLPGTVSFQLKLGTGENWTDDQKIGKPYTVKIKKPTISTNEPRTGYVGESFSLKAELKDTALKNDLVYCRVCEHTACFEVKHIVCNENKWKESDGISQFSEAFSAGRIAAVSCLTYRYFTCSVRIHASAIGNSVIAASGSGEPYITLNARA